MGLHLRVRLAPDSDADAQVVEEKRSARRIGPRPVSCFFGSIETLTELAARPLALASLSALSFDVAAVETLAVVVEDGAFQRVEGGNGRHVDDFLAASHI